MGLGGYGKRRKLTKKIPIDNLASLQVCSLRLSMLRGVPVVVLVVTREVVKPRKKYERCAFAVDARHTFVTSAGVCFIIRSESLFRFFT